MKNLSAPDPNRRDMLTVGLAARHLGISVRKLYYEIVAGAIAYHKIGRATRIDPEDLDCYKANRRINGKGGMAK